MTNPVIKGVADTVLAGGLQIGGDTWNKIQDAMRLHVEQYAKTVSDIAIAVKDGDIPLEQAPDEASDALLLFAQSIQIEVEQIALHAIQAFLNLVIDAVRTAINGLLPIAIL